MFKKYSILDNATLKSSQFRWYLFGLGISLTGSWLQYVALGWLLYVTTQSAMSVGINSAVAGFPLLFLPPILGNVIDRCDNKKGLLICTQSAFFILALLLSFLTATHFITYGIILSISFLSGIVLAIDQPLRQSIIPALIENKQNLPNAISWNALLNNAARIIGPMFAGIIVVRWGEWACFFIDALSFLVMILIIAKLRWVSAFKIKHKESFLKSWHAGLTYLHNNQLIKLSLIMTFIMSSTLGTYTIMMPIIAKNIYHGSSAVQGYLLTASGCGAVIGSVLMTKQNAIITNILNRIVICSISSMGALAMLVNVPWLLSGVIASTILGGSMISLLISLNSIIQLKVEDDKRGMALSFFTTALLGAIPLSNLFASALTDYISITFAMNFLSLIFFIFMVYCHIKMRGKLSPHVFMQHTINPD